MSSLDTIIEGAALFCAGGVLCYAVLALRDRKLRKSRSAEADGIVQRSRTEAETILRDARLAANEEALKLRQEIDQSFASRRADRAELEKRQIGRASCRERV